MNMSGTALSVVQIAEEIERDAIAVHLLDSLSTTELTRELSRLKKVRNRANRLNEAAFRDALAEAEAKAPALIVHNGMMSAEEIALEQEEIRKDSAVIRATLIEHLDERILLCRGELARRTAH